MILNYNTDDPHKLLSKINLTHEVHLCEISGKGTLMKTVQMSDCLGSQWTVR